MDCASSTEPLSACLGTILGTLRGTPPLSHRGHVAGVWLEGFSVSWCGGPDLFQVILSHEELLAEDKQFR